MSARDNELQFAATLHRGGVPKLNEAERDARIAERPIVERFSRGLGEKRPDPMAWWTTAEAEAANEEHIRAQLSLDGRRHAEPCFSVWAHRLVGLVLVALLVVVACDYLGWSHLLPGSPSR